MNPIRVFVADDHVFAVEGLNHIVAEAGDMEVVGQATTIILALELAEKTQPDVIVLDIAWQGDKKAGIKAIPQIKEKCPETQIVAITVYTELLDVARAAGAFPLSKGFSKEELLDTIRWAFRTKGHQLNAPAGLAIGLDDLTERELEVLKLIAQDLADKEIAHQLTLAQGTVKKHVSSIISKLGVTTRTGAAVRAHQLGLIK